MSDIYQQIWDADQSGSGLQALLDTEQGDEARGYVKVNTNLDNPDHDLRVLPEAKIPENKIRTYHLCRKLFDNYALPEKDDELETPSEREEVHDLVHAVIETAPMQVAKSYVAEVTGTSMTRDRWYNTIMDMWFRRFSMGGDPHLCGFEHVVVGEQQGPKAQGYHFWYKYYLDDGFARQVEGPDIDFPGLSDDRIVYLGSKQSRAQKQYPETVTISYRWNAPDYDRKAIRPLTKKIGGFFVGCSIEGLMALGAVRAHMGVRAPKEAVINGARYNLKVYRSHNNRHIRTFYPVFLGAVDRDHDRDQGRGDAASGKAPVVSGVIKIIAALINPEGHDPGMESITLINAGTSTQALDGWKLIGNHGKTQALSGQQIEGGGTIRVLLDPNGIQLSNNGGTIHLMDDQGSIVHTVHYSKGQARTDGQTVLF